VCIGSRMWRVREHWSLVLLASLVAFHALNNWAWLSTNVAIMNSDARRHVMTALTYSDVLEPLSLGNWFDMITADEYRPPLFQLSAVPLLWLFGRSTDVATMVNVVYLACVLGATYAIGRSIFDSNVGLLACFVMSTFPMIFAMSRYFYIDFALTAMVALNLALLLHTEDFESKGYTLLYGLSFGLGMLVKWTFVVFTLPPALLVFLRSGLPGRAVTKLKTIKVDARWAALSALMGLAAAVLWYLPSVDRARQMFLGLWLIPLSWVALTLTFYALTRPSSREANLLGAVMVGFTTASVWYMPRIDFLREFFLVAYGRPKGTFWGFAPYLNYLAGEQLSAFYVTVLLLGLLFLGSANRHRLKAFARHDVLTSNFAMVGLWAIVPYFVFSVRTSTIDSRFVMPILPALGLVIGGGLLSIPWRKTKVALVAAVVIVALAQFFALSYDELGSLREAAIVELPDGNQLSVFAHGFQNQQPSTGVTDSRNWIMPEILKFMREDSSRYGREGAELGILMNTHHVQASTFELVSMVEGYSELTMRELARAWSDAPVYPQLFEMDYLVLKDGSQKGVNREETIELVPIILSGKSPFLSEVFEVAQQYPLPDGDTAYLYRKKFHLDEEYRDDDYRALAYDLEALGRGDEAIIFEIPEQIEVFARHYRGSGTPYPLPRQHPLPENATVLELETIAADHDMIFALLCQEEQVDPGHIVESWLNRRGYPALSSWYGPVRLVAYASPLATDSDDFSYYVQARFGDTITLLGYDLHSEEARPGQILRVTLFWKADDLVQEDYKVFVHLLDAQGQVLAQHDSQPVGGSMPTSSWPVGETVSDNHGVVVPRGMPSGEYRLVLGMYDPQTGRRLSIVRTGEPAGDSLLLAHIGVEER